jgi:hypothetical protein
MPLVRAIDHRKFREAAVATGPMRFGEDNNAGSTPPTQTILRSDSNEATLKVLNEETTGPTGGGLEVVGGSFGVKATGYGTDSASEGIGVNGIGFAIGVRGEALSTLGNGVGVRGEGESGVVGISVGSGDGVAGRSPQHNGVQGVSASYNASGVYGENSTGGYGVAGRTYGLLNEDRAAVLGESLRDPSTGPNSPNGKAAGVYGYSETGYGGVFSTGQAGSNFPWANSGALRLFGEIVKTDGEYSEALPHPDGSQRLMYAPLSPESWYEDYGRAQLAEGRAEVELDADFLAVLGVEDGEYHVFLTPEGDSLGLYVDSRSARSFIVREQQAGTSNTTFSYRVAVKNRHRQPKRLAVFEETEGLTKRRESPSQLASGSG